MEGRGTNIQEFGGRVEAYVFLWLGDVEKIGGEWLRAMWGSKVVRGAELCRWCFGREGGTNAGVCGETRSFGANDVNNVYDSPEERSSLIERPVIDVVGGVGKGGCNRVLRGENQQVVGRDVSEVKQLRGFDVA